MNHKLCLLFLVFMIGFASSKSFISAQVLHVKYKEFIVPGNKEYGRWISSPEMKRKMREREEHMANHVKEYYDLYTNGLYSTYTYDTTIQTASFDEGTRFGFSFESKSSYAKDLPSGFISIRNEMLPDSICQGKNFNEEYQWRPRTGEKVFADMICKSMYSIETSGDSTIIWYCPEIPIPDGPSTYGGAPGLILAVESKDKNYIAEEISSGDFALENKNQSPDRCLSEKEFREKIREAAIKKYMNSKN